MAYQMPQLDFLGSASRLVLGGLLSPVAPYGDHEDMPSPPRNSRYSRITAEI